MERMVDAMQSVRELVESTKELPNRHLRFWRLLLNTKSVKVILSLAIPFTFMIVGGAATGQSFDDLCRGVRMGLAFIAIIYGLYFWLGKRKERLDATLLTLMELAHRLPPGSCVRQTKSLENVAKYLNLALLLAKIWCSSNVISLIVPLCLTQDELELKLSPWPTGRSWVIAGGLLQICLGFPFAYPPIITYFVCMILNKVQCGLQEVIADQAKFADTPEKLREVAIVDVDLTRVSVRLRILIQNYMLVMFVMLLVPTVSTLMVVHTGHLDGFSLTSVPYVVLFYTLCYEGQELTDGCRRVGDGLYKGHWLEVRDKNSCTIVKIMQLRRTKPLILTAGAGIGVLNLDLCKDTMKSYYQFLQLLLKIF